MPAIRVRMVSSLLNVSGKLAQAVAEGLGMPLPEPMPRASRKSVRAEVKTSAALSLTALPGEGGIATRKIAVLVAEGMDATAIGALEAELTKAGAVTRFLGVRLGTVNSQAGDAVEANATLENSPSVLFDGIILPGGDGAVRILAECGQALEFLKDQYRHGKTILALGTSASILDQAGIPKTLARARRIRA